MTLEEAIRNSAGFQQEVDLITEQLKEVPQNSLQYASLYRKMMDDKCMLKWYNGEYRPTGKKDAQGREIVECIDMGFIKKLACQAQKLKESSNLGARFLNRTFGNFDVRQNPDAYRVCRAYAERESLFTDRYNGLMLLGSYGTGKTHLAAAIANDLIDRSISVLFGTYSEHLEHIREEFNQNGAGQYLSMMKTIPVLVLDDLGKEKKTEWSQQILFDVINARYEHLLPVVITTNLSADELANHVGGAIWSRLYEMCGALTTKGKDFRKS